MFKRVTGDFLRLAAAATLTAAFVHAAVHAAEPLHEEVQAKQILSTTGVRGGIIVHLGCGDGTLTAALGQETNDAYLVHGLDADPKNVEAARKTIRSLGLYGRVSVEQWTRDHLPYADNLVNLVVSRDLGKIPMAEVIRVLAPGGACCLESGGKWTKTVKPCPKDIDEWTHFLHDAGNNAVADDARVGPPRSLQWMAPPLWLRSHETPSGFEAMVSGGGRLFYLFDEGLIGITDQRLPERWSLVSRDAFNGKLLWKRPISPWGWPEWAVDKFQEHDWTTISGGRTVVPNENQRRLVVDGDRLYATLGYREPLAILDAATGKTLVTVAETAPARQLVAADGVVVVYSNTSATESSKRRGTGRNETDGALIAVRGATGAVLWRKSIPPLHGLSLAVDHGRVVYQAGKELDCLDLQTGNELWQAEPKEKNIITLVAHDGLVVLRGPKMLETYDGAAGRLLWSQQGIISSRMGNDDLFVIDGVVWPGVASVNDDRQPGARDAANVLTVGYDLKTGQERRRIFVPNLISPEHHHRCYRNKATDRYVITSMEGAEFVDLEGSGHTQSNFVRGACKLGMMPANGMLYVPPDQCFCQPGAKQLGLTAITSREPELATPLPDDQRLERGPAYGKQGPGARGQGPGKGGGQKAEGKKGEAESPNPRIPPLTPHLSPLTSASDWPTYRHDAARHGSTPCAVAAEVTDCWRATLGGGLTPPVVVGDRVYAASRDTHTLHVLQLSTGRPLWTFVAGGRIDSPPTVHGALVLFGSADGRVYCLRADDGVLVWRFLAAPCDRRIACFDQLESTWPVHGSVLVRDGVAYVAAGRSTYLDGGIRLYGLDPASGKVLHQTTLSGPFPDGGKTVPRDVSFYIRGANSDVLLSEGDAIYMRQKRLTPSLQEQEPEILSTKGESDVGLHVFSTTGLLDGSWYNRTFWMYSKRWPGFQLANQAPKSGQLLVVDGENTYGVNPFYHRNCHTPMFFPGKEGYLLFADRNGNEPQIVGDAGARTPVAWLPQSDYGASRGLRRLDSDAFGVDKGIGYTRAEPPLWTLWLAVRIRAMVKASDTLFVAGVPDVFDENDPYAAFEGRKGARLVAVSAPDGKKLAERTLDAPPVFDGMIAAHGRLLVALEDGSLMCLAGESK